MNHGSDFKGQFGGLGFRPIVLNRFARQSQPAAGDCVFPATKTSGGVRRSPLRP